MHDRTSRLLAGPPSQGVPSSSVDPAPAAGEKRGASLADVARLAGVSAQTVSRVANGSPKVVPATRETVLEAMRRLNYRPNSAARALRRGSFRSIGVITFTLSTLGNSRTVDSIAVVAADLGYSLTLLSVRHPTTGEVSTAFSRLDEDAVDGVLIILEEWLTQEAAIELPAHKPVVFIDSAARTDRPMIDTDQRLGAMQATQHLLDLGHPTVWHVTGPASSVAAVRRQGAWRATLEAAGRTVPEALHGDWTAESGYRIGLDLAGRQEVSAVFASNDQMALGILRAMHESGREVPGNVSVVGFDDMAEAGSFWPPLTTVRQHFDVVGRRAVEALVEAIESGDRSVPPDIAPVPTELVVRASSGPYRPR